MTTQSQESESFPMPDQLTVGTSGASAKNHALCWDGAVIAVVIGAGYPIGAGWSPRTEAYAREIAHRYNMQPDLVEALEDVKQWIVNGEVDGVAFDELSVIDILDAAIAKATGKEAA